MNTSSQETVEAPSPAEPLSRLENLAWIRAHLVGALREWQITDYRPGEVWYNHNEYPARPHRPIGREDEERFAEYRDRGVEIIKLHQEWADPLRLCGGDHFSSNDPEGFRRLLALAHSHDLRVHVYFSSGFFDRRDPDFRPEWTGLSYSLDEAFWRNALCSPLSSSWRRYLLAGVGRLLDTWEVDGLYNDCGYPHPFHPWFRAKHTPNPALVRGAFYDTPDFQESFEDLLGELYTVFRAKRPGGLMTLHFGGNRRPPIRRKFYDTLYVGEGVDELTDLCAFTKAFDPVTMLIPDARLGALSPRAVFAAGLPYLQFPVLYDGAPLTGERVTADGVAYLDPEKDYWRAALLKVRALRATGAHPTYGWWDSIPGNPHTRPTWFHFLPLWRRMASNGTRIFMEAHLEGFWESPPRNLVQSVLVNDAVFLIVANPGSVGVSLTPLFAATDVESGRDLPHGTRLEIPARDLRILRLDPQAPLRHPDGSAAPDHLKI